MNERKYKICLSVPIGQREGSMYICESDGRLISYAAKGTIIDDAVSLNLIAASGAAYRVFGKEIKQNE